MASRLFRLPSFRLIYLCRLTPGGSAAGGGTTPDLRLVDDVGAALLPTRPLQPLVRP
jgi:hypothetical protein